jgi:D-arabinose 1-dehydrogenase-like Zn-dependent alcohol dehydrogenase
VKAVRFHGPRQPLALEAVPDPAPGPQEVVVRVEACGVCASDLHFIDGELPLPVAAPLTLGHEPAGVIAAVGTEVPVWREGARVGMFAGRPCMQCRSCAAGMIEDCRNPQVMGAHYDGAWAEYVVVPWYALAELPDGISFEHGAIACDAVSTPYAALIDRGGLRPGERVGLWGIGGLGTHAVQIARLAGASFVAAVDPLEAARERAVALGADLALDPSDDVPNAIRDATAGRGLDLAADLIGRTAVLRQATMSMARGGRVVLVGQSLEPADPGPIVAMSFLGIGLLGHLGYRKEHLEEVLTLMASGRLDVSASVSGTYPLERAEEAVERLASKRDSPVRLLLEPRA